jgi:polysaccharide biosynthesis/export protein
MNKHTLPRTTPALLALAMLAGGLGGCKSFMDPTKLGRYSHTPTVMPILDRIASIEDSSGQVVEYVDAIAEDLIPQPESYRIGPGDALRVIAYDIVRVNQQEEYEVPVDARGMIEIPQLGRISVNGLTTQEATEAIADAIAQKGLVQNPLVQVLTLSQRQQTFTVIGAIQNPGLYPIPRADYRLLEAIAAAGQFDDTMKEIYVIRQVPLSDEVTGKISDAPTRSRTTTTQPATGEKPVEKQDMLDLINEISPDKATDAPKSPSPGMMRRQDGAQNGSTTQPAEPPAVDLIENDGPRPDTTTSDGSSWVFLNGKWVRVKQATEADALTNRVKADELITQRVIRIPIKDLLQGKQSINVVIRAGDVIRFPSTSSGFVYMGGDVARPGPYQVASEFTLLRAIDSAGGLNEVGIPERVELTRMLPGNRQAVIRLDLQAISEHTQPDIFLKSNDRITVGTNGWALPLAVIRNGLRVSYGFGFILDRNLSNDLIGPPPINSVGQ